MQLGYIGLGNLAERWRGAWLGHYPRKLGQHPAHVARVAITPQNCGPSRKRAPLAAILSTGNVMIVIHGLTLWLTKFCSEMSSKSER